MLKKIKDIKKSFHHLVKYKINLNKECQVIRNLNFLNNKKN
jgi:hypothetical protein